ncbi:MAG: hypothetical protein KDE26_10390 [Bacteroidetes bacterium]|nr:hypothetical protein [Bacteroidota bacterium]MCB0843650.1 hypothetical protein [Bacteroidota bacterium]
MIEKLRFLIITDHRQHRPANPVYSLTSELFSRPETKLIDIVSRGNPKNDPFFTEQSTHFYTTRIGPDFSFQPSGDQFIQNQNDGNIEDYDVVLMRLARPVDSSFLHFVAHHTQNKVVINHPLGIEKTSSKAFLLNFPDLCPPIKLCHKIEDILSFMEQFPIVLKPLKEYGGKGILRAEGGIIYDQDQSYSAQEYLQKQKDYIENQGYLAMKFMKNVSQGDKRIIVAGGEILAASLRKPAEGSWLCNVSQGGSSESALPEAEEVEMINRISPTLLKEGILIYGADTLVNDDGKRILSEINTLSVGGFADIQANTGIPIIPKTIDKILAYVNPKYNN